VKKPQVHKLTIKQERFCQAYIETGNASEAYRRVYGTAKMKSETMNRNAKAMTDNSKIATRVRELAEKAVKRHEITVESLTERAIQAFNLAISKEQSAGAVSALSFLGKLHGVLIERKEVGKPGDFDNMTSNELRDFIASEASAIGVSLPAIAQATRGRGAGRKPRRVSERGVAVH
jgi:hypothetical protein